MVSMVRQETDGEVVYLYDAESERGNANFAFRAVRFKNPTTRRSRPARSPCTATSGSSAKASPSRSRRRRPRSCRTRSIARSSSSATTARRTSCRELVTLQRGILTAEVQHIRRQKMTITNRLHERREGLHPPHREQGLDAARGAAGVRARRRRAPVRGRSQGRTRRKDVEIAEATPIERTLDLNADVTLDMMKVYVDAPEGSAELKDSLKKLLAIHKKLDRSHRRSRTSLRSPARRLPRAHGRAARADRHAAGGEDRRRPDDATSRTKMKDISDRVQKTTIAIVDTEEKIMLTRVAVPGRARRADAPGRDASRLLGSRSEC